MKNYRRLFKFLKSKLHWFFISLLMVIASQVLAFITPLLVKVVLDDCIMGIEYEWNQVADFDNQTVSFNNNYYKQTRYLDDNDKIIGDASVVLYKNGFYFTSNKLGSSKKIIEEVDGKYIITIKENDSTLTYEAVKLNKTEVFNFYKPITPTLIKYIIFIFVKTILSIIFGFLLTFSMNKVINYIANEGRTRAFTNIEYLPISFFEEEPAGKMAHRITKDVDGMIIMYRQLLLLFASAILSFIFAYDSF